MDGPVFGAVPQIRLLGDGGSGAAAAGDPSSWRARGDSFSGRRRNSYTIVLAAAASGDRAPSIGAAALAAEVQWPSLAGALLLESQQHRSVLPPLPLPRPPLAAEPVSFFRASPAARQQPLPHTLEELASDAVPLSQFSRGVLPGDARRGDPEGSAEDEAASHELRHPRPIPPTASSSRGAFELGVDNTYTASLDLSDASIGEGGQGYPDDGAVPVAERAHASTQTPAPASYTQRQPAAAARSALRTGLASKRGSITFAADDDCVEVDAPTSSSHHSDEPAFPDLGSHSALPPTRGAEESHRTASVAPQPRNEPSSRTTSLRSASASGGENRGDGYGAHTGGGVPSPSPAVAPAPGIHSSSTPAAASEGGGDSSSSSGSPVPLQPALAEQRARQAAASRRLHSRRVGGKGAAPELPQRARSVERGAGTAGAAAPASRRVIAFGRVMDAPPSGQPPAARAAPARLRPRSGSVDLAGARAARGVAGSSTGVLGREATTVGTPAAPPREHRVIVGTPAAAAGRRHSQQASSAAALAAQGKLLDEASSAVGVASSELSLVRAKSAALELLVRSLAGAVGGRLAGRLRVTGAPPEEEQYAMETLAAAVEAGRAFDPGSSSSSSSGWSLSGEPPRPSSSSSSVDAALTTMGLALDSSGLAAPAAPGMQGDAYLNAVDATSAAAWAEAVHRRARAVERAQRSQPVASIVASRLAAADKALASSPALLLGGSSAAAPPSPSAAQRGLHAATTPPAPPAHSTAAASLRVATTARGGNAPPRGVATLDVGGSPTAAPTPSAARLLTGEAATPVVCSSEEQSFEALMDSLATSVRSALSAVAHGEAAVAAAAAGEDAEAALQPEVSPELPPPAPCGTIAQEISAARAQAPPPFPSPLGHDGGAPLNPAEPEPLVASEICSQCGLDPSERLCYDCQDAFCAGCFKSVHCSGKRRFHVSTLLDPVGIIPRPPVRDEDVEGLVQGLVDARAGHGNAAVRALRGARETAAEVLGPGEADNWMDRAAYEAP